MDSQTKACIEQLLSSKYRSSFLERKRKSDSEIPFKSYYNIIEIIMGFICMHGGVIFSMNVNISETYEWESWDGNASSRAELWFKKW